MKKFCFIIVLSFLSFRIYGIHNLLVNGSTTPTVTTVDTLNITASFNGSGVAKATMYYDINDNGQLDPDDPWLFKSRLIDGSFDDEDEIVNGVYYEIREPFTFSGKFIFYAEDNGVSDTVLLTVNPLDSPYYIYGKVTNPANRANILVSLIDIDWTSPKFEPRYGDFTDSIGSYKIPVPPECADKWWDILAFDVIDVAPFYVSNKDNKDSTFIADSVMKDLAMIPIIPPDTTVIWGVLKDDAGDTITDPTKILIFWHFNSYWHWKQGESNNSGAYRISLPRAFTGYFYFGAVSADIVSQFYPEYMSRTSSYIGMPPSPLEKNLNCTVYRTTNTISGQVYKDGTPYDKCQLEAEDTAAKCGDIYTKTYSDGHYEMWISDSCPIYTIKIASKSIPEGYTVTPDEQTAAPGDTGINFSLIKVGIEESSKPQPVIALSVHPNPFMSKVVFELSGSERVGKLVLYDIAGNRVTEVKPKTQDRLTRFVLSSGNKKLPTGIYFYSLKAGSKVLKGKVIKLR